MKNALVRLVARLAVVAVLMTIAGYFAAKLATEVLGFNVPFDTAWFISSIAMTTGVVLTTSTSKG